MYLQIYFHKIDMYVKNLTQVSLDIMSRSSEVILYNQPYIAMLFIRYSKNYYVFGIFAPFFSLYKNNTKARRWGSYTKVQLFVEWFEDYQ